MFPYYEKAADMGWAEAEATVAYWKFRDFIANRIRRKANAVLRLCLLPKLCYGESIIARLPKNSQAIRRKPCRCVRNCWKSCPKDIACVHIHMPHWEMRSTGEEGGVAEEAAYYEKSLEIVPNLYTLKNLGTLYFAYRN